jgi:hypothetical protein
VLVGLGYALLRNSQQLGQFFGSQTPILPESIVSALQAIPLRDSHEAVARDIAAAIETR